ncbi:hypothetical protein RCK87_26800, partial [Salmonella enterica subsp. enterica serovar 1,4,[5],12:i:-]
ACLVQPPGKPAGESVGIDLRRLRAQDPSRRADAEHLPEPSAIQPFSGKANAAFASSWSRPTCLGLLATYRVRARA